jgi:hypothetical protein
MPLSRQRPSELSQAQHACGRKRLVCDPARLLPVVLLAAAARMFYCLYYPQGAARGSCHALPSYSTRGMGGAASR